MGVLKVLLTCCIFVVFVHEKSYVEAKKIHTAANKKSSLDDIVQTTLNAMKSNDGEAFKKLEANKKEKQKITNIIKGVIKKQQEMGNDLTGEPDDIEAILKKHLSADRIELLKGGLSIPTFKLNLKKHEDGMFYADYLSDTKKFTEPQKLSSQTEVEGTKAKQWASVVVEGVLLVCSAAGISGARSTERALEETEAAIRTMPKFQKALEAFKNAWEEAGNDKFAKGKALFFLIKDTYSAGIFWNIIKSVFSHMSWLDWLETAAKVTAMLIAEFATDGAALIAEIALVVLAAADFARKMVNMKTLQSIKTFA